MAEIGLLPERRLKCDLRFPKFRWTMFVFSSNSSCAQAIELESRLCEWDDRERPVSGQTRAVH
eukprot:2745159-Pyramimonas_sp.AAC.1